jgi:type IV secretory pathway VirB10-like protein
MAELKRGDEAQTGRREISPADNDSTVVAPRFDEREEATARPVVPLGGSNNVGTGRSGRFSLRANSRHLLLAWAVLATLAAGGILSYRNALTSEPQVAPQPAPESTTGETVAATPQPAHREVPVAPPRAAKMTEARNPSPSWEVPDWSDRGELRRDEPDEEELDERARKEEKRRRKEEKRRREEAEERREEAEKDAERALKASRKQAERGRERGKDEGGKARLVGVIGRRHGM